MGVVVVVVEAGVAVVAGIRRGRPASRLGVRTREVKQMGRKHKIFVLSCPHMKNKNKLKLQSKEGVSVGTTLDNNLPTEAEQSGHNLNKR